MTVVTHEFHLDTRGNNHVVDITQAVQDAVAQRHRHRVRAPFHLRGEHHRIRAGLCEGPATFAGSVDSFPPGLRPQFALGRRQRPRASTSHH